jgi:hypothetical protein
MIRQQREEKKYGAGEEFQNKIISLTQGRHFGNPYP